MLNYLELKLRKQYEQANVSGIINKDTIDSLKNKIDKIRYDMAKGVKIRTRLQDAICGENISNYLIAKQKEIAGKKIITSMTTKDNEELNEYRKIQQYSTQFFRFLYSKSICDLDKQTYFLSYIDNELTDADHAMLSAPLSKEELYFVMLAIAVNKTPGIDGLPVEFYLEFWQVIADDILEMYNEVLQTGILGASQRKAIINIIPKNNETKYITNFRPISLLCVDYKILAKLLSERIKKILCKIIHSKQFCAVPGRNINQCNMELRDIVFYANQENLDLAILNLDWYKAFDTVSIEFVIRILENFGFGETFISWISTLYNEIESTLSINNILGDFFPVTRSVRQGCPLSMALFIAYQEPFYRALVASRVIRPLTLPGNDQLKLLGYADDTNVIVRDSDSLMEINRIITEFELATGSKLNRNKKTKIFGVGRWKGRQQWPMDWLKSETEYMFTLGIYHGNEYLATLEKNWSLIYNKIQSHTHMLHNRRISLLQRVAYANSCILSKVWYVSHIYPLTGFYAKDINRTIFRYIWCGRYEPVRRTTVFKPKCEGGLGLINCQIKSKVLFANSFLKCYSNDEYKNPLMIFYCYIKMNNVIEKCFSVHNAAIVSTPYY